MGIQIRQPWNHKNTRIEGAFGDDNVVELGDGRNIIKLTGLDSTVILGDGANNRIQFIDPAEGGGGINRGTVGNGGHSVLIGAGKSRNVLISNGGAEDHLYGGNLPDILMAMGPSSKAYGRGGNDTLVINGGYGDGGAGNDSLQGYNGSTLHGGGGKDTFTPMILGVDTRVTIDDFDPFLDRVNLAFLRFRAPGGVHVTQSDANTTAFSYTDPDEGAATLTLVGAAFTDVNQDWIINAPTQL